MHNQKTQFEQMTMAEFRALTPFTKMVALVDQMTADFVRAGDTRPLASINLTAISRLRQLADLSEPERQAVAQFYREAIEALAREHASRWALLKGRR